MMKQDSFILIWMEKLSIANCISDSGALAVDDIDLRIDAGEYVCISGLHGSDKISFINVLSCLNKPKKGKYLYDYNDITTMDREQLGVVRSCIGFVFRTLNLALQQTVFENIEIPLLYKNHNNTERVAEVANNLGIKGLLYKQARKLHDLDRHKVALARALVVDPVLVMVDEPAWDLNQEDREAVLDILDRVHERGTAVICFSERNEIIDRASRHIIFEKGKIVADKKSSYRLSKEGAI